MAITPLPPAPLPSDTPSEFNTKAFDLVAALDDFVTEANAQAVVVNADAVSADADATTATTQAGIATTQAGIATTAADEADASATEAAGLVENYQGALESDPSLNKDGEALQAGDWYVNTTSGLIRAYTGSAWVTSVNVTAGVSSFSAGSTGLTPSIGTQGDITLSGTLSVSNGGTGLTSTGASGNLLISNGTGWVSTTPTIPNAITAIATGSLSDGSKVIVNADGTVSVVAEVSQTLGSTVTFESASTVDCSSVYDPINNKIIIAYIDYGNSVYGTAIVGTISGTSISFGTPVVFNTSSTDDVSATYDSINNKIVIAFRGTSNYGYAIVGTVSGTSISFGSATVFESATVQYVSALHDLTNNKIVIAYMDSGNSSYGTAVVGTVSGTSISFGTPVVFRSGASPYTSATYDLTNSKVVIAYRNDGGGTYYGNSVVGTVSGTSISFGSPTVFESAESNHIITTYDSNNSKVVIAYADGGNSQYGTAVVGTVSGTSISFGTPVVFESASSERFGSTYDANARKVVIAYKDNGNSGYGTAVVGDVSGTSISFGTPVVFSTSATESLGLAYDSTNTKVLIAYRDNGGSGYGKSIVFQLQASNLNEQNYIGISNGIYSDGATATIQTIGAVDDAQSGLTAGKAYYIQATGTLSTTPGTPSVFAGTAISTTKLIVKG